MRSPCSNWLLNKLVRPVAAEITSLSRAEKIRLSILEQQIEKDLGTFLSVAKCLAEIRSSRLYREHFADFSTYCRERFCLARSSVDCLIRSGETAQLLIENGAQIPAGLPEVAIRPISALPFPELQTASWKLVQAVCPDRVPTGPVSSKIVRTIRNAIEPDADGKLLKAGDWRSLAWSLERAYPAEFARPEVALNLAMQSNVTENNLPIQIKVNPTVY